MDVRRWSGGIVAAALFFRPAAAQTGLLDHSQARFLSGTGYHAFLLAGTLLPLTDGERGAARTRRTINTLITTGILCQALKATTREPRPDTGVRNSFPSGHTTAAFAVAALQARNHPRTGWLWFLGAAAIGDSRVTLRRHHPIDIVAGALLGGSGLHLPLGHRW